MGGQESTLAASPATADILIPNSQLSSPPPSTTSTDTHPPVIFYFRQRIFATLEPYLPTSIVARLSNYTPLTTYTFADQAAAGMSSSNFDLEANLGEGSSENRMGLDDAGVEEVRRIM